MSKEFSPGSNIKDAKRISEIRSARITDNDVMQIPAIRNDIDIRGDVFDAINMYRSTFTYVLPTQGQPLTKKRTKTTTDNGKTTTADAGEDLYQIYTQVGTPSLFNPYFSIAATGPSRGVPLLDNTPNLASYKTETYEGYNGITATQRYLPYDISDCSIRNLVRLSEQPVNAEGTSSILGNARYKYSDFMYCKELGKMSNNHLITLRKFNAPVQDNIFQNSVISDYGNLETSGDIGRLITWFGTEDNKLEDILKYTFRTTWKELNSEIQEQPSQETAPERGILGSIVNTFNPNYASAVLTGVAPNSLGGLLGGNGSSAFFQSAPYEGNAAANGSAYDKNKVYEPRDTIRSTYIYDGKLEFEHEVTLTFNYKLRAYDNINPKSAFLDLLANILQVTYKKGTFWAGEQRIIGAPGSKSGWQAAQAIAGKAIGGTVGAAGTMVQSLFSGGSFSDAASRFASDMSSVFNGVLSSFGAGSFQEALNHLKNSIASPSGLGGNIGKMMSGSMMNALGRPAVYAFNSLLTNGPVGMWHLTIGNPLNPIAVMGNMILTDASIQQLGPLGLDDFPTELKVTVTLKHGMPRDAVDIAKMYTRGEQGIYSAVPNWFFKAKPGEQTASDVGFKVNETKQVKDPKTNEISYVRLTGTEYEKEKNDAEFGFLNTYFGEGSNWTEHAANWTNSLGTVFNKKGKQGVYYNYDRIFTHSAYSWVGDTSPIRIFSNADSVQ